jgi:hypothetical protein
MLNPTLVYDTRMFYSGLRSYASELKLVEVFKALNTRANMPVVFYILYKT